MTTHSREHAQEKAVKVITDIVRTMFNPKFVDELFKPQELYSSTSTRQIFDRIAHSSIMRLSESSMDKARTCFLEWFRFPRMVQILLSENGTSLNNGISQTNPILTQQHLHTYAYTYAFVCVVCVLVCVCLCVCIDTCSVLSLSLSLSLSLFHTHTHTGSRSCTT